MAARFPITALIGAKVDGLVKNAKAAFAEVKADAVKAGEDIDSELGGKTRRRRGSRFGGARTLAKDAATAVGGGVVAVAAVAAKRVFAFEKQLEAIATQADATAPEVDALRQQINATSRDTGLGREQVAAAVDQLVNLEGGAAATAGNIDLMGRAVKASGAGGKDLAGVMFALNRAFFDGKASTKQMESALSSVLTVGKKGSIPLSEMSTVLQQVASQFDDVSTSGTKGATDLAAALQAVRPAFGSAAEAGTGLRAAVGALVGKSKELEDKFGVSVFNVGKDGERELKPLREILDQIAQSELAKRPDLLQKALGSKEALAFTRALMDNRDTWDELADAAAGSTAVQDDFLRKTRSQAGKAGKAMNELNVTIDEAFTPERIEVFVNALSMAVKGASMLLGVVEAIAEGAGELAAKLIVGNVEARNDQILKANQLLKEQVLALSRGEVSSKQAAVIRQRGIESDQDVRAEASRQIVKTARREGLVEGDEIQRDAVIKTFGIDALRATVALSQALELARQAPVARSSAAARTAVQATPPPASSPPLEPMMRSLAVNQQRIADAQETTATQLATTARLLERAGTR